MANTDNNAQDNGALDPIIPIDFTPHEVSESKFTYKFHWFHAVVAVFVLVSSVSGWFVLTARSVFVEVDPITASIQIDGGLNFRLGQRYLIRTGSYEIRLRNEGYHDMVTQLLVDTEAAQTHPFTMRRLPGLVSVATLEMEGARVQIDGVDIGETPLVDVLVEPGEHQLTISNERYLDYGATIEIEGRSVQQSFEATLEPAWATLSFTTAPPGADIIVDGETVGVTPFNVEILQGERDVTLKLAGHKAWQEEFDVIAGEDFVVPPVELEPADGLVFIQSNPTEASVTIGGEFQGLTPLEVALAPNQNHELTFFKNGFQSTKSSVRTAPNEETSVLVELAPVTASVQVISEPADAELYINGEFRGLANQTLELMAVSQQIEVRKEGFVPYSAEFTSRPGLDQIIRVNLKS
ncbi:MAG: PEGA domain-containing protein, partial [Pseudomonadales bacterium]|nr:PEGA domain-containing protein [Pseudomonadales bacterium]